MLEKRLAVSSEISGHEECVVLLGLQCTAFEKRNLLIEHRCIAGRLDVLNGAIGEPDHIIADAGADALSGRAGCDWGQPPVLHIALDELPPCRRAADALASGPASRRQAPFRPEAGRESRMRRWPDRTRVRAQMRQASA